MKKLVMKCGHKRCPHRNHSLWMTNTSFSTDSSTAEMLANKGFSTFTHKLTAIITSTTVCLFFEWMYSGPPGPLIHN